MIAPTLEGIGDLKLELAVVDARQVDAIREHLLPEILGGVDGGEDAVELLVPIRVSRRS